MKINVIITSYNHEKYIAQCLKSVLQQKGDFQLEVIVGDDCSTDNTRKIIEEFRERYPEIISILPMEQNLGITKNLKQCLDACSGEYIAICEGDDYWTDEYKLQKQMTFLEKHQDFSMCFSAFMIYREDINTFEPFQSQLLLTKDVLSTEELILNNSIGNFSCCMYRTKAIKQLPDMLFELFTVDWMFNMVCGQFGKIGFIRDWMSVYRKHSQGVWAGRSKIEQTVEVIRLIDEYNRFFKYKYNNSFLKFKEILANHLVDLQTLKAGKEFLEIDYIDDNVLRPKIRALQIEIAETKQTVQLLSSHINEREQVIQNLLAQINTIYQSTSWKLTQPIRNIKSLSRKLSTRIKDIVSRIIFLVLHISSFSLKQTRNVKRKFSNYYERIFEINRSYASSLSSKLRSEDIKRIIEKNNTHSKALIPENKEMMKISVVVISYNQERYITECLEGIYAQNGNFVVELVIGDDCSTDKTLELIKAYGENHINGVEMKILNTDTNIGMTKNLQRCLSACTGDYIAICEGDDYWFDDNKLQKQLNFLLLHPECVICFNRIYMYFQNTGEFSVYEPDTKFEGNVFETRDLVKEYFIGNLSCCMYDAKYLKQVRDDLFNLFIGDWMFNIYYSKFGKIGYLDEIMSVYRKHDSGAWGNELPQKQARRLYNYINTYNKFLDYEFDREFSLVQKKLKYMIDNTLLDVIIIDDVAPHPLSAFRMQEFLSYMESFENLIVYCSGISIHLLGEKSLDELMYDFSKKYPQHTSQIDILKPTTTVNTKLIYTVLLGNTFMSIQEIEETETPFVFCLYPGGMFGLNNEKSDAMLKRVTSSPCFRKVIVTQKITYDYLIEKKYCTPDQIEFIFGVVTPLDQFQKEYIGKKHFGSDKETLDICFVAHKYTENGIDKGYDVFVEVATALAERYSNIQFHVVGGFDQNILDISHLKDRIKFYGSQETEWFDDFYRDKDIILSPNIPFKIFEGSFDGFPTGSCTDAGLRETAIFCTDELKLNDGFFANGDEIVIIPHDVQMIVDKIEYYYQNPDELVVIAKNGQNKIKQLYGYGAQILPRINLLQEQIDLFESNKAEILKKFDSIRPFQKRLFWLPKRMRRLSSKFFAIVRKNVPPWLKNGLKRILPSFIIRIYERFFI